MAAGGGGPFLRSSHVSCRASVVSEKKEGVNTLIVSPVDNADDDGSFLGRQGRGREAGRAKVRTDIIVDDGNDDSARFGWL